MAPNSDFRQFWSLLVKYIRPYWRQVLLTLVLYLFASLLTAAQPMVTAPILEIAVKGPEAFNQLSTAPTEISQVNLNNIGQYLLHLFFSQQVGAWQVVLTIALIYLLISVSLYLLNFGVFLLATWTRVRAGRDMQAGLFAHVTGLSMDFFNARRTGELISRLDKDTDAVVFGLESIVRTLIVSTLLTVIYGALLIKTSPRLTLFVVAAAACQYLFVQAIRRPVQNRVREQFNMQARVTAYLQEVLSNIRIVKSFVAEKYELTRLRALSRQAAQAVMRFTFYKNVDEPATFIINSVVNVVILLFATSELLAGRLTSTGFFLYLYVGRSVLDPLTSLARTIKVIQTTVATSERVQELFATAASVQSGRIVKNMFETAIKFKNVSFAYGAEHVLQGIQLEIKKGSIIALVGHSGAGKSTIADLVLRFYDPQSGQITIDGEELRNLDLEVYRKLIGVVSQDSILFNSSVAENIAYPGGVFDQGRVEQAARIANAHEFVTGLTAGYQTFIGDRGVLLSGGQKQRITIARAVYHEPQILILDEATSSLDTESERLVQQAIDNVVKKTTAIVIAHRLSTVIHADKIVVMDAGRIVDQGTHKELLGRCQIYIRLCELQFDTKDQLPEKAGNGTRP
jgi:subfamily B ATP-binding cassette protein MsbA